MVDIDLSGTHSNTSESGKIGFNITALCAVDYVRCWISLMDRYIVKNICDCTLCVEI